MSRQPITQWQCLGTHPEGNMWAVEIPTGVLIRYTYFIPGVEGAREAHSLCFVPGLQVLSDEDHVAYLATMPW